MRRNWEILFLLFVAANFLSSCSGPQSSLNPAGDQANSISHLWWIFCAVMSVIYTVVLLFAILGVSRRNRGPDGPILLPNPKGERRLNIALGGFVGVTT